MYICMHPYSNIVLHNEICNHQTHTFRLHIRCAVLECTCIFTYKERSATMTRLVQATYTHVPLSDVVCVHIYVWFRRVEQHDRQSRSYLTKHATESLRVQHQSSMGPHPRGVRPHVCSLKPTNRVLRQFNVQWDLSTEVTLGS